MATMQQPVLELAATSDTLSFATLVRTLEAGLSRNDTLRENATRQVGEWEKKDGYYSLLQNVLLAERTSDDAKVFAATQLKNGLDKFWRKSAVNAIKTTERDQIRSLALESCLKQENVRIVRLAAICAAKIARVDFPNSWPNLLKDLIAYTSALINHGTDVKILVNTLVTSLEIVKELITLRISRPRQMIEAATPEFVTSLMQVFQQTASVYAGSSSQGVWSPSHPVDEITLSLEVNLRILKMLRRLSIHVFQYPHRHDVVVEVWNMSQSGLQQWLGVIEHMNASNAETKHQGLIFRHLKQLLKFHHDMASKHPVSFGSLPGSVLLARQYFEVAIAFRQKQIDSTVWQDNDLNSFLIFFELKAMQIQRACLKLVYSVSYPLSYRSGAGKEEHDRAKEQLKQHLFTDDYQLLIIDNVLTKFLVFVQNDFEEWESEAEQWEQREDGDEAVHEREVRPCSEKLLLDVLINAKYDSNPKKMSHLLGCVQHGIEAQSPIAREAALAAIGIAAPCLKEGEFDYKTFVVTVMVPEMKKREPTQAIIRRRISIVASQWAVLEEKMKNHDRGLIYEIFASLLDPNDSLNNQVVRITTGKRLESILQEFEFDTEKFSPYITSTLTRLANLVQEAELTETKLGLVSTMAILIEKIKSAVNPYANDIVMLLQPLWSASDSEVNSHAMKRAIIQVLYSLVKAMTIDSKMLHDQLLPVIQNAFDRENSLELLHEEALILWQNMISYSHPPLSATLSALRPLLVSLLDSADWKTPRVLGILRSYILLSPEEILDATLRDQVFVSLAGFMDSAAGKYTENASACLCLIIQAAQSLGGEQGLKVLNQSLHESRLIERMLQILQLNREAKTNTSRGSKAPPLGPMTEQHHFLVLSRLVLAGTDGFLQHIKDYASEVGEEDTKTIDWLVGEWFDSMDSVVELERSKLLMMALTRLFETGLVTSYLQDMLYHWTSVLIELRRDDDDPFSDSLFRSADQQYDDVDALDDIEERRENQARHGDPVHTLNLAQYVHNLMNNAIAQSGGSESFKAQWLAPLDQHVVKEFLNLGIL